MENRQEANHRESQGEDHQADSSGDFLKARRSFHGRNSFFLRFWSSPWTVRYSVQMIFETRVSGFEKKVKNYFEETSGSNLGNFSRVPHGYQDPSAIAHDLPCATFDRWPELAAHSHAGSPSITAGHSPGFQPLTLT
jgi:hypothetical protein